MKKAITVMVCLLLLVLSACSSSTKNEQTASENGSNKNLQKLTIMLDWYPNAVHSFLYVAQEKGYFKQQGLDVNIEMPANADDPLKLLAANKVDMAISYPSAVLVARDNNIPVKSFAAIVRHPLNVLMAPKNGPVKSPKDLEGKTLLYVTPPFDDTMVKTMVKADGGDPSKMKLMSTDGINDLIAAMTTNKADALIGGYQNHEKLYFDKEKDPMNVFSPQKYGVPDYYELVLAAGEKTLKEKPDLFKKFMAAAAKGQQYVQAHPQESLNILFKHADKSSPLDKTIEPKSLQILIPMMDAKDKPFGYQDSAIWKNLSKWMYDNKILKTNINPQDAFTNL